jgi:hypothetical protein
MIGITIGLIDKKKREKKGKKEGRGGKESKFSKSSSHMRYIPDTDLS